MALRSRMMTTALVLASSCAVVAVGLGSGCSASPNNGFGGSSSNSGSGASTGHGGGTGEGGLFTTTSGPGGGGQQGQNLVIKPQNVVLTYNGSPVTQQFEADQMGAKVPANWSIDNVQIGTIDANGLFTGAGEAGGTTKITAQYGNDVATTNVTVNIAFTENPGNVSPGDITILKGGGNNDPGFKWLYPYDETVFPRGLASPTLQFGGTAPTASWVHVETASKSVVYDGFYGASNPGRITFSDATWATLTGSVGAGEDLIISVTKLSGGKATGPIKETWKVAQAKLKGTLYYNSYDSTLGGNIGAILKLKPGQNAALLQGGGGKCTVCHTVSANGNTMIASNNTYDTGAKYDLQNNAAMSGTRNDYAFNFPGVSPDGTVALSTSGRHIGGMWGSAPSKLYNTVTGQMIAAPGFDGLITYAAMPAFSPDGTMVVFNDEDMDDRHTLAVMNFDKATNTFSSLKTIAHDPTNLLGWPSFLPDNKSVLCDVNDGIGSSQQQGQPDYGTWFSNRADLAIVDLASSIVTPLDALNGKKNGQVYLPWGADDARRNFEPTVAPVAVGGYYWVVFTSRRQYGNTINTVETGNYGDTKRKKIWIAAIDINPVPGKDPSHPAVYMPGQEDASGNMRGFWALDPCMQNGNMCDSGDECCTGYCRQVNQGGQIEKVCVPPPMGCAQEFENCNTNADCCGSDQGFSCINHHCAQPPPK